MLVPYENSENSQLAPLGMEPEGQVMSQLSGESSRSTRVEYSEVENQDVVLVQ
jgi:hypothetical protein